MIGSRQKGELLIIANAPLNKVVGWSLPAPISLFPLSLPVLLFSLSLLPAQLMSWWKSNVRAVCCAVLGKQSTGHVTAVVQHTLLLLNVRTLLCKGERRAYINYLLVVCTSICIAV